MVKQFTDEDDALLTELGVEVEAKPVAARTPEEERVIAGFEEIQRFVEEHGHSPCHGEDRDIFERLYAVRLDRIRDQTALAELVRPMDSHRLLSDAFAQASSPAADELDDDALLAELGIDAETPPITELRHVRSTAEKRAAEEVALRERCEDFETFRPLFDQVQSELDSGLRETRPFEMKAEIEQGRFFIVGGQKAYVAEKGEVTLTDQGRTDARLRVIFDNGTESNMLMRSLQRALNKDEAGRRITEPTAGPLFAADTAEGDEASGTIYVLRSKSDLPLVVENRNLVHKIGVTNMEIGRRVAGAHLQPTFLMAGVEVVATYELFNINRTKLENLIHRIFAPARLDIEVMDRFGNPVVPREWFLVPLAAIDEAVEKIKDGTITGYAYDPSSARLVERSELPPSGDLA
ncbi:GIY-YIG nuclease family protein [Oceaniradius stylonematis]|uniref:GIY-YIG nuclease family protein n=1 Tax=Oceaniradius stylonematis TaxID=2184161 RepID=UPI00273DA6A5|nr:GIY-YIG nuclease family protein [Oceaniradius stylonematis]